jgi:SAM-dependent methyltransferase
MRLPVLSRLLEDWRLRKRGLHARQAGYWESRWRSPRGRWLGRDVSPEIVAAVDSGWLRPGGRALDAGCGEGRVAEWLSQRGFTAVGVDIAPSAIARARALCGESPALRFAVADLRTQQLPDEAPFDAVIDRGCFHQMRAADASAYAANLASLCAPGARLLLFHRAYRDRIPHGDPDERLRVVSRIERAFAGAFAIEHTADTWVDPAFGSDPSRALGGIAAWLRREA